MRRRKALASQEAPSQVECCLFGQEFRAGEGIFFIECSAHQIGHCDVGCELDVGVDSTDDHPTVRNGVLTCQLDDVADDLAFEGGCIEPTLAGEDDLGVLEHLVEASRFCNHFETWDEFGADGRQSASQTASGTGTRKVSDVGMGKTG